MKNIYSILFLILIQVTSFAQTNNTDTTGAKFSLKEAIDYAVINNINVKNSDIDRRVALGRKGEVRALGLPQINGTMDFTHNINIQKTVSEYGASAFFPATAANPVGTPAPIVFGLHNQSTPNVTASQILFDQAFFSNLNSVKVYEELSAKNILRTKIETAHQVTKAYYAVLVNQKQLSYLNVNLARLDSSYLESKARLTNGLTRQIDVDRIEVSYNNLKEERTRITRIIELSKALLKFQMNLPIDTSIVLTDDLNETILNSQLASMAESGKVNYTNRIEYSILNTQILLSKIDTRTAKANHYPKLSAFASYGYTTAATNAGDIFTQSSRWFNYSYVGVRLNVPIFNGFSTWYKVQQKKLEEERVQNNKQLLEHNISLQVDESIINLNNSLESLKTQKRNLDLAEKNLKVLKAEFEQGVSMSLDVTVAEASFKEAQNNYYNALYNALLSKADYERAIGTLYK